MPNVDPRVFERRSPAADAGGSDDVLAERIVIIRLAAVDLAHQLALGLCHGGLLAAMLPHVARRGKGQREVVSRSVLYGLLPVYSCVTCGGVRLAANEAKRLRCPGTAALRSKRP